MTAAIIAVCGLMSLSHGAMHLLVWPLDGATRRAEAMVSLKPYEIRQGPVSLAPEMLPQSSRSARRTMSGPSEGDSALQTMSGLSGGDIVTITFFADVTYQATVDSVTNHPDGTRTISARLNGHDIATVVVTIGPDGFLITLQDLNRALLYRVTGDSLSATGTVTEIDVTKIPPMTR